MADVTGKDPQFDLLYSTYKQNPNLFTNEDVDFLKERSKSLGADFQIESNDFNLIRTAQAAVNGFITGFTTMNVGEQPRNDVESIFHNIGHLAGFMGYVPGAGTVTKMMSMGFARGITHLVSETAGRKVGESILKRGVSGLSIPMLGASWLQKGATNFIAKNAALESIQFLKNSTVRDLIGGSFHLGVASAISAAPIYQVALDDRIKALESGAEAGLIFKVIGNGITVNRLNKLGGKLGITSEEIIANPESFQTQVHIQNGVRAVAASLYMGLPSTMENQPGLMQAYQYISGAAFGYREMSAHEKDAKQFVDGKRRQNKSMELYDVLTEKPSDKDFLDLTPEAQELVKADVSFSHGKLFDQEYVKKYVDVFDQQLSEGGIVAAKALKEATDMLTEDIKSGKIDDPAKVEQAKFAIQFVAQQLENEAKGLPEDEAFTKTASTVAQSAKFAMEFRDIMENVAREKDASMASDALLSNEMKLSIADHIKETGADARFTNIFYEVTKDIQQVGEADQLVSEGEFRRRTLFDILKMSVEPVTDKAVEDKIKADIDLVEVSRKAEIDGITEQVGPEREQKLATINEKYEVARQQIELDREMPGAQQSVNIDSFVARVETKYGKINDKTKRDLIKMWFNVNGTSVQKQFSAGPDGKLKAVDEVNPAGERNIQLRPFSFMEDIITGISGYSTRVAFLNDAFDQIKSAGGSYNQMQKLYGPDGMIDVNIKDKSILPGILLSANKKDMMIVSGLKANDTIILMKSLVKEEGTRLSEEGGIETEYRVLDGYTFTVEEKLRAMQEVIDGDNRRIVEENKSRPADKQKKLVKGAFEVYIDGLNDYLATFAESEKPDWKNQPEEVLAKMYEKNYANNIAVIEQINGDGKDVNNIIPYETIMANPENFITKPEEFNKRAQLMYAGEHKLRGDKFADIKDMYNHPQNGPMFKFVILDEKLMFNETHGVVAAYEMRDGVPTLVSRAIDDGAMTLRSDMYDRYLEAQGLEPGTGHQKGVGVHTGDGQGALMLKFAYHRASPALDEFMFANGLHSVVPRKVAKQRGFRDMAGLIYNEQTGYRFIPGKEGRINFYDMPVNKLTTNFSAGETAHNMADQRAVVQMFSNLNLQQAPQEVLNVMKEFLKEHGYTGNIVHNTLANEYNEAYKNFADITQSGKSKIGDGDVAQIVKQMDSLADKIDVSKLGFIQTIQILKAPIRIETKLYDKVMRHILKLDKEGEFRGEDDGIVDQDTQALDASMDNLRMGAMRVLDSAPKITPAIVEAEPIRQYANAVITSHLTRMLKRPLIPYSMKAVMSPMYLDQISKFQLRAGEYMLDDGAKTKKIMFTKQFGVKVEMELGEAWDMFNKSAGQLKNIQREDLTHAVIRVPADSISGIRMLKFMGFTGIKGYGTILHPEDMINLGGADYDIDSAFIYTHLPDAVKAVYGKQSNMYEWYKNLRYDHTAKEFVKGPDGKYVETHADDPNSKRVFAPAKAQNLFNAPEDPLISELKKHPVSTPNPLMAVRVNQDTHLSNMALGPGLNHTRRLRTLFDMYGPNSEIPMYISKKMQEKLAQYLQSKLPKDAEIVGKLYGTMPIVESSQGLRNMTREIVNVAADAEGKLRPNSEIANIIMRPFVKGGKVKVDYSYYSNGKKVKTSIELTIEELAGLNEGSNTAFFLNDYNALSQLDNAFKGYDYGNKMEGTLPHRMDIREVLDKMTTGVKRLRKDANVNVLYGLAQDVVNADIKIEEHPKIFGSRWTGVNTGKQYKAGAKAEFDAWMKSDDPSAQLIRKYAFRDELNIATSDRQDTWAGYQDAMDVVTALQLKHYGEIAEKAGVSIKEMEDVVVRIDDFKKKFSLLNKLDELDIETEVEKYLSKSMNKTDLYKEVSAFFEGISKKKELFDFASEWYNGSIYSQMESKASFLRSFQEKVNKYKALNDDPSLDTETHAENLKKLTAAQDLLQEKKKQWYQTNMGMLAANSNFIPDYIIRNHWGAYSDLVGATFKSDFNAEDVKDVVIRSVKGPSPQMKTVLPEAVAFGQTASVDDLVNAGEVERFKTSYFKAIPDIAKMDLDLKYTALTNDLRDFLYKHPNMIPHFNEKLFGQFAVDYGQLSVAPNIIRIEQLRQALEHYKSITDTKNSDMRVRWWHHMMPPALFNKKFLPYDANEFIYDVWPTVTGVDKKGAVVRDMPVRVFYSSMELMREFSNSTARQVSEAQTWVDRHWADHFSTYMSLKSDARDMFAYVTALRERNRGRESAEMTSFYEQQYQSAFKKIVDGKYMEKEWIVPTPDGKGTRRATFNDVVAEFKALSESEAKMAHEMWVHNPDFNTFFQKSLAGKENEFSDNEKEIARWVKTKKIGDHVFIDEEVTKARLTKASIEGAKFPLLSQEFLNRLRWQHSLRNVSMTGEDGKETTINKLKLNGEDKYAMMKTLLESDANINKKLSYKTLEDKYINFNEYHPHVDHTSAEKKAAVQRYLGKLRAMGLGEPDLQRGEIEAKNLIDHVTSSDGKIGEDTEKRIYDQGIITPEQYASSGLNYVPDALKGRNALGPIGGYDKTPFAWLRYHSDMSRGYFQGMEAFVSEGIVRDFENGNKMGENTGAWAKFLRTYRRDNLGLSSLFPEEFMNDKSYNLKNTAYWYFTDQAMFNHLQAFEKKLGVKFSNRSDMDWENYKTIMHDNGGMAKIRSGIALIENRMKTYVEDGKIGQNIGIMAEKKGEKPMAILVGEKASKMNIGKAYEFAEKNDIPIMWRSQFDENLNPVRKKSDIDEEKVFEARRMSMFLNKLSVMEGKFELATLLSHTKSMMGNMTTGGINTAIHSGIEPFRQAASLEHIRSVMPEFKSWDDVNKFRERFGALESYTKETIEEPVLRSENWKRFFEEATAVRKKDPNVPDATIVDLAKKYKLGDAVVQKAASFMRSSETIIRGHSWMAHYMKARQVLEANNYVFSTNSHPWLIQMANRGTAASQFLYNNANKPAFGRTNLGKIFFRFQQWTWQSLLMRKDIIEQAGGVGLREGTPEMDRFRRMLTADLFVFGLASLFPQSIFKQNVPPPLSSLVQLSDYFFGDKKEKDDAFFGAMPYPGNILNPIIPPIGRIPGSVFGAMVSGDWDKFFSYHMYTWFPFGRMVRDVNKTLESPTMLFENMANIPVHAISREVVKGRNERKFQPAKQMFNSFLQDALRNTPE